MRMRRKLLLLTALALAAGLGSPASVKSQYTEYYRRALLVYVSGGPVLPLAEDQYDEHDIGLHLDLGMGFVLASGGRISPELGVRYSFHHLPRSQPTNRFVLNESDNENSIGLEGRFRIVSASRWRPFFTVATGLYDVNLMTAVGGGIDLTFDPEEQLIAFAELRFVKASRNMIRLDVGIRIG